MRFLVLATAVLLACSPVIAQEEEGLPSGLVGLTEEQVTQYQTAEKAYEDGDYTKARAVLNQLTADNVGAAWWLLGVLDFQGLGTAKNVDKAREDFIAAAKSGSSFYQTSLGDLYKDAEPPFTKDCDQAEFWYKRAAMQGNEVARGRLQMIPRCRGKK